MTKKSDKHRSRRHDFIAAWLRSPLGTGAVLPSSPKLAQAMADQVDIARPGAVIELGAGTGVMTYALLEHGLPADRLLVVERDKKLHAILEATFPGVAIICGDAAELDRIVRDKGITQVNAIVSSLPLITLPKEMRTKIVAQMAALMRAGAPLIQFTLGIQSPLSKAEQHKYGITGKRIKIVMVNIPPAHVWVYGKANI